MNPQMIQRIIYTIMILGLASVSIQTWMIADTISEMNARQKNVVVSQHKAIEDKISKLDHGILSARPDGPRNCCYLQTTQEPPDWIKEQTGASTGTPGTLWCGVSCAIPVEDRPGPDPKFNACYKQCVQSLRE
jgi:hypothetical protein